MIVGIGVNLAFQSIRCKSWPTTEGIVRTSEIGRHRSNKGGTTYSADVSYDYSVGGSRYTGTKLAVGAMSSSSSYAQGVLKRYPVGAKVTVHYSPSDPETAVLETGIHGGTWICFGVGSVFTLFGAMFLQALKRQPDSPQAAAAAGRTDGRRFNAPQILMAVIIFLFGASPIIMAHTNRSNAVVMYLMGGVFCIVGLYVLTYRPGEIRLQRFFSVVISLLMLGVFNWVVFGGLGQMDTFSAIILGVIDFMSLAVAIGWFFKRMKVKARGL
ncbi:MAG: DUF3592 domain-containing protein [Limisphaerales bacterium]